MSEKKQIFIDSCAWNILFEHNLDLKTELSPEYFEIKMTKEVMSFEVESIPQKKLKQYIEDQIKQANIEEDSYFGFSSIFDTPSHKSRFGGFGKGRFATHETKKINEKYKSLCKATRPTGLYKNEADSSLALRAGEGHIVLTAENPNKKGPMKKAIEDGGLIISIKNYNPKLKSLAQFITDEISKTKIDFKNEN